MMWMFQTWSTILQRWIPADDQYMFVDRLAADQFYRKRSTKPLRILVNESKDESKPWKTMRGEIIDPWEGTQ